MITGHLATSLVGKRIAPEMPWWLLGASALLIDIAMLSFVLFGVELMVPHPEGARPTMSNATVEMTYSHDLLPQLFWVCFAGALAFGVTRNRRFALVAMALTIGHWLCDLVSGYGHFVFGPDSHPLGTNWYQGNLLAAVAVEAALGVACVLIFTRGREFSPRAQTLLYLAFGVSPFALLII